MMKIVLKHKIKKLTDENVRIKKFRDYKDIRRVILLFNIENLAEVETFVAKLTADGKQVTAYSFEKEEKVVRQLPDTYKIWNKSKLDFFHLPKKNELAAFVEDAADTLIDLTIHPSLVLRYLFLTSTAEFRVGFNRDDAQLYDLLIERNQEQDFSFFVDQLLFYMKRLRTK